MSEDIQKAKEHFLKGIREGAFAGDGKVPVNIDGAIQEYTTAISICPDYADAYYNRGLLKKQLGDEQGAEADFKKAEELFKL